jgi:hypothetical protein
MTDRTPTTAAWMQKFRLASQRTAKFTRAEIRAIEAEARAEPRAVPATFPLDLAAFVAGLDSPNHSDQSRQDWCRLFFRDMQQAARAEPRAEGLRTAAKDALQVLLTVGNELPYFIRDAGVALDTSAVIAALRAALEEPTE